MSGVERNGLDVFVAASFGAFAAIAVHVCEPSIATAISGVVEVELLAGVHGLVAEGAALAVDECVEVFASGALMVAAVAAFFGFALPVGHGCPPWLGVLRGEAVVLHRSPLVTISIG